MKIHTLLLSLLPLFEVFTITVFAIPDEDVYLTLSDPSVAFTYNRLSEVEKQCGSFLSSSSQFIPDDEDTKFRFMTELSFKNGDWEQKTGGGVPLMPFSDSGMPSSISYLPEVMKLVSFEVKDVSPVQHFQNTVSVGGILVIGISKESSFVHGFNPAPNFIRSGTSALTFAFEGIYSETRENGGERRLCLLGKSTVTSGIIIDVNADLARAFGLETDRISLALRYPMNVSLTKRAIHGEMKSLDEPTSHKYFNTVYISSLVGRQSTYQFSSKVLASTNCEPYLYHHDEVLEDGVEKFTWSDLCTTIDYVSGQVLSILPNYKFSGSYLEDNKLGFILFGKEIGGGNLDFNHAKLIVQNVKCSHETTNDNNSAKVSAVLRVIPEAMDQNVAQTMTGLSGLILNAEGRWNPSSGQLCLLGCPVGVDSESECTSWISLYFPRTLSIKQRSMVLGSIFNIRDGVSSNYHLLFDLVMQPSLFKDSFHWYRTGYLSYNYSKVSMALSFKRQTQHFASISRPFLRYPDLKQGEELLPQLDFLSSELLVHGNVSPDRLSDLRDTRISVQIEVLSLGPVLGRFDKDGSEEIATANDNTNSQILNVSAHLVFREWKEATHEFTMTSYKNISQMFLEGVYDPLVGEMHLIGCRKVATGGTGIGRGLDCLIEVKIQYPSKSMGWFMNPKTKITITSRRSRNDPLYFSPISLQISTTRYRNHTMALDNRITFEGMLRILLLSGVIAITLTQLHYMKEHIGTVPYVSLVMLTLQILAYSLPLVGGAEILLKFKESTIYMASSYDLGWQWMLPKFLDYAGRVLLLVSLLLTSRIFLMVYKSQNKLLDPSKTRHPCGTYNMLVLLSTLVVHTFALRWLSVSGQHESGSEGISFIDNYGGVLQDFFLLPQIFINLLWKKNVKSLAKGYYIGLTLVRLILHLYDHIMDPTLDFKFQDYQSVGTNNTSTAFNKSATIITMIMLAAILHIQQNWKYQKPRQLLE